VRTSNDRLAGEKKVANMPFYELWEAEVAFVRQSLFKSIFTIIGGNGSQELEGRQLGTRRQRQF
jgi:hypothetical protein